MRAQARREQRRSTILAAATRVFKDRGYHGASVHDIIDAAQIARGTFYLYFTSKREVFAELSATFLELIRGSVRRVMNTVLAHGDLAAIMLRGDAGDAEARAQLDLFYQQVVGLIGEAVRVGHKLGFARDCDVDVIAVAALAGLKEVLGRMLDARPPVTGAGDHDPGDREVDGAVASPGGPGGPDGPGGPGGPADPADPRGGVAAGGDPGAAGPREPAPTLAAPTHGGAAAHASGLQPRGAAATATAASPWRMPPERLADELLTFFVRGVFTQDAR